MRRAHPLDLAAPLALAAITLGVLVALTPARAARLPHPATPHAALRAGPSTWTPPPPHPAPRAARAPRVARPARGSASLESPGAQAHSSSSQAPDDGPLTQDLDDSVGLSLAFDGEDYVTYGHRGGRWYPSGRARSRTVRRGRSEGGSFPWVGATAQGEPASLCTLLPSLCGGGPRPARRPAAAAPTLSETPTRITLSNAEVFIDIARVSACAVRVRRADTGAETLLTFALPDELVPCEARVVPDVLRDDGVAVRLDAQTPRWSQSVTVSLGDDGPAVSVARATREGAVTTHRLVNASAHAVTFTLDDLDLAAAPGETLTVTGS
ncbi:MAG: hypothetical protein U0325_35070 [Polyangiales bacterium]